MIKNILWYSTLSFAIWGSALGGIEVPGFGLLYPFRLAIILLTLVVIFSSKKEDWPLDRKIWKTVLPLILFMTLLGILSLIWTEDKIKTLKAVMNLGFIFAFLILFFYFSKKKQILKKSLIVVSANFSAIILIGVYEMLTANYLFKIPESLLYVNRISPIGFHYPFAVYTNTNDFAFNLVLLTPLLLYTLDEILPWRGWLQNALKITVVTLSFIVLVSTSSRIGLISYLASVIIYLFVQYKKAKIVLSAIAILVSLIVIMFAANWSFNIGKSSSSDGKPPLTQDELAPISKGDTSTNVRITVLIKGLYVIRDTFGLGIGTKNSPALMKNYTEFPTEKYVVTDYHFFYMELFAEFGILVLAWFLYLQGDAIRKSWQLLKNRPDMPFITNWAGFCLATAIGFVFASACSSSCLFFNSMWIILALWSHMPMQETRSSRLISDSINNLIPGNLPK